MTNMHYIGFDIHKKTIAFCEKRVDGSIVEQNTIPSTRNALKIWASQRKNPWIGAMVLNYGLFNKIPLVLL